MSDRDELAALMKDRLREVYMTATGEKYDAAFVMDDDPLNDVVVDGHVDFIDLATTILARWRLVPVEEDAERPDYYRGYRDAQELASARANTYPDCGHERRPGTWGHNGECIACAMSARGNVVINTGDIGPYEPA